MCRLCVVLLCTQVSPYPLRFPITCAALTALVQALGNVLRGPMADIIPLMFNAGLTELLADALKILSRTYPKLLPIIQERLLEHLSMTLTGLPYLKAISSHSAGAAQVNHKAISANSAPSQICLALRTLGSFNFRCALARCLCAFGVCVCMVCMCACVVCLCVLACMLVCHAPTARLTPSSQRSEHL